MLFFFKNVTVFMCKIMQRESSARAESVYVGESPVLYLDCRYIEEVE